MFYPIIFDAIAGDDRVDLILIETVSSIKEADITMNYAQKYNKPYWISFTLDDTNKGILRSGEEVSAIEKLLEKYNNKIPEAILFNCSHPEVMNESIKIMKNISNKSQYQFNIGVYANLFEEQRPKDNIFNSNDGLSTIREDISPERYLEFAKQWYKNGATIIGGCCGIGPEFIDVLAYNLPVNN